MEEKLVAGPVTNHDELAMVVTIPTTDNSDGSINGDKKKKTRGGYSLFKAARLLFRGKLASENAKPKAIKQDVEVASKGNNWKNIVGSMRPLTLQEDNPSPPSSPSPSASPSPLQLITHEEEEEEEEEQPSEQFEDVLMITPSISPSVSSSSISSLSQYASADNLQALDKHGSESDDDDDDEEDEDQVFDDKPADAMIDAKAEEFIAHFYAQMRRQQVDSANRSRKGY